MNQQRRKRLSKIINELEQINSKLKTDSINQSDIKSLVECLGKLHGLVNDNLGDEEEAYESMPEGLQYSERGESSQSAIDALHNATQAIEEAIEFIQEAIDA